MNPAYKYICYFFLITFTLFEANSLIEEYLDVSLTSAFLGGFLGLYLLSKYEEAKKK